MHVVGDVGPVFGQAAFDYGVPAGTNLPGHGARVGRLVCFGLALRRIYSKGWTHPAVAAGQKRKIQEHVELGHRACVAQQRRQLFLCAAKEIRKNLCFEAADAFAGLKDSLFLLLELWGDVALGIHEGLLANPVLRNAVLMAVAHLEVVAKNAVEVQLERGYSAALGLGMEYCFKQPAGVLLEGSVAVQVGVDPGGNGSALGQQGGRILA